MKEIDEGLFEDKIEWKNMFLRRLEKLKNAVDNSDELRAWESLEQDR